VVLKNQRYADADLIVTYLTPDRGIVRAFAKSPRKIKSKFGSSLEPLTHARVSFLGKEHSMPIITQSDIINPFNGLRENYHDFINISRLIRIILFSSPEGLPNKRLFTLFHAILSFLNITPQKFRETLHLVFMIRLLAMIGYAPRLNRCGRCGRSADNFYPESGSVLCDKCISDVEPKGDVIKVSKDVINFYTHSIEWPVDKLSRLRPRKDILSTLSVLINRHISENIGIKL